MIVKRNLKKKILIVSKIIDQIELSLNINKSNSIERVLKKEFLITIPSKLLRKFGNLFAKIYQHFNIILSITIINNKKTLFPKFEKIKVIIKVIIL